jgi:hypothetical protein
MGMRRLELRLGSIVRRPPYIPGPPTPPHPIISITENSGLANVLSTAHGLVGGEFVSITTDGYASTYKVRASGITADTFFLLDQTTFVGIAYVADGLGGTWRQV